MSLFSRITRRVVFATALALVLSGALLPSGDGGYSREVNAKPAPPSVYYEKEIIYYSDATHTTEVGWGHIFCNGRGTLQGTSSPYSTEEIVNVCCGGVPC